jgi:hypothetical protein
MSKEAYFSELLLLCNGVSTLLLIKEGTTIDRVLACIGVVGLLIIMHGRIRDIRQRRSISPVWAYGIAGNVVSCGGILLGIGLEMVTGAISITIHVWIILFLILGIFASVGYAQEMRREITASIVCPLRDQPAVELAVHADH